MIDASATTTITLPLSESPPAGYVINDSSHGYGVFIIDPKSLAWFENNLGRITNKHNRQAILVQMFQMMQFGEYGIKNLGKILKQLEDEKSTIVLELIYKIMHKA